VHRARWPTGPEVTRDVSGLTDGDLNRLTFASGVTARIRQERSTRSLGFGVPVRVTLVLPQQAGDAWSSIEGDVLEGNNVRTATVVFGSELAVTVEPDVTELPGRDA
jgi:hypothetical protein